MFTVTLTNIERRYILSNQAWEWLNKHLNTPLQLCSISIHKAGNVSHICVRTDMIDDDGDSEIVVLFVKENGVSFTLTHEGGTYTHAEHGDNQG